MSIIWYSFINGIIFIFEIFKENFMWIFFVAALFFLVFQERKVISDDFVEEERTIL